MKQKDKSFNPIVNVVFFFFFILWPVAEVKKKLNEFDV